MATLEMILKSGKIENEEQAAVFAENADFVQWEKEGWGDYRIELDGVRAEIYGVIQGEGDLEEVAADPIPQDIRFYDGESCDQIENPYK